MLTAQAQTQAARGPPVNEDVEAGARTVGLTSGVGGKMTEFCDAIIAVPSKVTARIQEMHILIGHMLCKALERRLGLV